MRNFFKGDLYFGTEGVHDKSSVVKFKYISLNLTLIYMIQRSILSIFSQIFQINGLNGVLVIELTTNLPESV